tara:strand:- start:1089 stop:1400 length:312 start_codon:yes stop_codon:yes gene_type:complete
VEVLGVLTQQEKDLVTMMFSSLVTPDVKKPKEIITGKTMITVKDINQQVLRTLITKGKKVSCKDGDCRIPKTVDEIPPNLLNKSSKTYKNARQKLYYLLKKKA